ncbi:MAG: hypothetical protein M1834_001032 [Cirrosporium novae-zelandiae]|nr:MAG: hypothetical protein M1834_001032 [Cirrosporium novae-zelandiae]
MKFLCLHGAGTSAKVFEIQTAALRLELARDGLSTFEFLDGEFSSRPAPGIGDLFEGPYYSFYPFLYKTDGLPRETVAEAHALVQEVIEDEGPFDGIIGFSQGAALAASILIHHAQEHPLDPPYALFRCAIFICGSRPFNYEGTRVFDPKEGHKGLIRIPTTHIVGAKDGYLCEGKALYELCDKANATLVMHSEGHMIPADIKTTRMLADAVRLSMERAMHFS